MSNIRGLDDGRERLLSASRSYPLTSAGFRFGTPEEARKETFLDMLKLLFCPLFHTRSFIFGITVVDLVVYLFSVFYDFNYNSFLEHKVSALNQLGAKNIYLMQEGEVWRFFTPVLLHANVPHLVFNFIMQMLFGFRLEPQVGKLKTAMVYFVGGVGGVLFSSLVSETLSVGASTAIFSMNAAMISWIVMNWKDLERDSNRNTTTVWLVIILVFNLMLGTTSDLVDNWGHFGGMITGFLAGYSFLDFLGFASEFQKKLKKAGSIILLVYFVLGLLMFYLY